MGSTALLLIDVQLDYFDGGAFPLDPAQRERALATAARLLGAARRSGAPVFHVQHVSPDGGFLRAGTPGIAFHPGVAPRPGERVVVKRQVSAFHETPLEALLREARVERLVVGGMIAWMCVQSAVRAASERGFDVRLVPELVASRALAWRGIEVDAERTLAASLAPLLAAFARETSPDEAEALLG
jgi:nicotinamidase-related amidase